MIFDYAATVDHAWIDYNGHMQDAYYGLVFSHAVDAVQDAVGLDAAYRAETGCTVYLLEDHKHFLREVHAGALLSVRTRVLAVDERRFVLWADMLSAGDRVAVSEMVQAHVHQRPTPRLHPMPDRIVARLRAAVTAPPEDAPRARPLALRR